MSDLDLADLRKQCVTSLYLCTENVSKYVDSEKEAEFDKLRSCVQSYCMLEAQQNVAVHALERAKRETDASNLDTLEQRFAEHLSSMAGERLNVDRHPYMLELGKRIQKGTQNRNSNLDESDLAITETQTQYLDPITKKAIVDPVKNTICGHIYEKESIMKLIMKNSRTKCPVAGCGNREPVQQGHLLSDEELKFRMALTQHSTMIQEYSILDLDTSVDG